MGQYARSNEATVEVVAAPGFRVTVAPGLVQVRKGDMDMVAKFAVGVVRDIGFDKPVYLLVAGFAGRDTITPNPVPANMIGADLAFDMSGMDVIDIPFAVQGFEDNPGI
jgi:hypothetical protein